MLCMWGIDMENQSIDLLIMRAKLKNGATTDYIKIDSDAKTLAELPLSNGHYVVWQTTIDHLNAKKEITLDENTITSGAKPLLIYQDQAKASGEN